MTQIRLSGGDTNDNPDAGLGGEMSSTQVADAVIKNVFDNITRKEVLILKTEYRCIYVLNDSVSDPIHGAVIFIDEFPFKSNITMGLDPVGSGDGINTGVAQRISREDSAPIGVTFEDAGEFKVKLPLPTLKPSETIAIWIKRISEAGKAQTLTLGLTIQGDDSALPTGPAIKDMNGADGLSIGERTNIEFLTFPHTVGKAEVGFSTVS